MPFIHSFSTFLNGFSNKLDYYMLKFGNRCKYYRAEVNLLFMLVLNVALQ